MLKKSLLCKCFSMVHLCLTHILRKRSKFLINFENVNNFSFQTGVNCSRQFTWPRNSVFIIFFHSLLFSSVLVILTELKLNFMCDGLGKFVTVGLEHGWFPCTRKTLTKKLLAIKLNSIPLFSLSKFMIQNILTKSFKKWRTAWKKRIL